MSDDQPRPYKALGDCLRSALYAVDWSQERLASFLGISPQAASEYLNGVKVPGVRCLANMSLYLNISIDTLIELANNPRLNTERVKARYEWERLTRREFEPIEKFLSRTQGEVSASSFIYEREPQYALSPLTNVIQDLERRCALEGKAKRSRKIVKEIKSILLQAYIERMACHATTSERFKAVTTIQNDFDKARHLAEEMRDDKRSAHVWAWLATAYYIDRQYEYSLRNANKALGLITPHENVPFLFQLFNVLVIGSVCGNRDYKESEKTARALLDSGKIQRPQSRASLLEAMGRASALSYRLPEAHQRFDEAERECKSEYTNLIRLQINRGKLLAMMKSERTDTSYAEEIGREAFKLAKKTSNRYVMEIQQPLKKLGLDAVLDGQA
jgi:transcriptional regulator with XRE-family HTH domain